MKFATMACLLLLFSVPVSGEEGIVPKEAKVEKLWGEGAFTEGPAQGPDGCIYFSDIGNRIMKYDPATGKKEFRNPSGRANGLDFDLEGRLVAAKGANTGGNRRVSVRRAAADSLPCVGEVPAK